MAMLKTQNQESDKHRTLYYEVSDSMVPKLGGKYFVYIGHVNGPQMLAYGSDRIWEWDRETDSVQYIKNRDTGLMTLVDRKEFLLIQLRAEEY
jgi:hypothetical protein